MKIINVAWMWTNPKQSGPGLKTGKLKAPILEVNHDDEPS